MIEKQETILLRLLPLWLLREKKILPVRHTEKTMRWKGMGMPDAESTFGERERRENPLRN